MTQDMRLLAGGISLGIAIGLELARSKALKRLSKYRLDLVREDDPA